MAKSMRGNERAGARPSAEQAGGLANRLLAIGKDCAAHLKEPYRTIDHGELLYDDRGMPR
jgi:antitoxin VapB